MFCGIFQKSQLKAKHPIEGTCHDNLPSSHTQMHPTQQQHEHSLRQNMNFHSTCYRMIPMMAVLSLQIDRNYPYNHKGIPLCVEQGQSGWWCMIPQGIEIRHLQGFSIERPNPVVQTGRSREISTVQLRATSTSPDFVG